MWRLTEAAGNFKAYSYEDATDIVAVIDRHRKTLFEDVAKKVRQVSVS
jgi:hypothetical protein